MENIFIGNIEVGENNAFTVHADPKGSCRSNLTYLNFEERMSSSVEFRPEFYAREEYYNFYALLHTLQLLRWPLQKIADEGGSLLGFSFEVDKRSFSFDDSKTIKVTLMTDENGEFQFLPKDAPLTEDIIRLLIENHTRTVVRRIMSRK